MNPAPRGVVLANTEDLHFPRLPDLDHQPWRLQAEAATIEAIGENPHMIGELQGGQELLHPCLIGALLQGPGESPSGGSALQRDPFLPLRAGG